MVRIDPKRVNDMKQAPTHELMRTAHDIVESSIDGSRLFKPDSASKLPRFDYSELTLGRTIGRGGFCTVTEITAIRSPVPGGKKATWLFRKKKSRTPSDRNLTAPDSPSSRKSSSKNGNNNNNPNPLGGPDSSYHNGVIDETINGTDRSSKEYMSYRAVHRGQAKYVIKRVAEEWEYQNRITFLKGVIDLAMETKFLNSVNHPNIIEPRGFAEGGAFQPGYFIVLDRLHETLPKKIKTWTTTDRQCKGITGVFVGGKAKVAKLITDRLRVAFDVASALHYMHSMNIVYRDLKPDNIGFDVRNSVKIFDFGLAKEMREEERNADGLFKMTGFTGSIRYMAPEVGLRRPYNHTADIYSFSMLLWYILALEPPYGFYTPEMFLQRVFQLGHRPVVMQEWPENIQTVMKRSWDVRLHVRPSFNIIMKVLKKEASKINPTDAREFLAYTGPMGPPATIGGNSGHGNTNSGPPRPSQQQQQQKQPPRRSSGNRTPAEMAPPPMVPIRS
eukprot:CAMPEP_0194036986 /NCGR_PEP_ID=MMETSP0009_2-20130614/9362_1 /TAXON_ID=210454 /ORGANISM="Grammatophora oceanica, Strain CCMP 410" /LENGTH=501 /DNA_ID=CAMNT_0038678971 /DNA_START=162 /DNA_END=1667 /DNA_ORIENTATION=+